MCDCNAGYDEWPMQWVKGWGGAKKVYCCRTAGRGCASELPPPSGIPPSGLPPAADTGPYDCEAGYHPCFSCLEKHWSANKLDWCCREKGKGCRSRHQCTCRRKKKMMNMLRDLPIFQHVQKRGSNFV